MAQFGKGVIPLVTLTGMSVLVLTTPVYALVVAAPLVAISAIKAAVFLVSIMAFPVTTLIHIVKRQGIVKTVVVSLAVLCLVFSLVFGALLLVKGSSAKRVVGRDISRPAYGSMPPPKQISNDHYIREPRVAMVQPASWTKILLVYAILTVALCIILLIPVLIILIVSSKVRKDQIGLKRLLVIGILTSLVIAIPLAFGLGLLYTLTSNSIAIY